MEQAEEVAPAAEAAKPAEKVWKDAPADSRKKIKAGAAAFNMADSTLNVMPGADGKMLMTLCDGGFQYLLAGTRSTVGLKAGRYMFEVTVVESLNPMEVRGQQGHSPQPRQLLRLGFSTAGSSLFLGDGADSVCFDSDGSSPRDGITSKAGRKFGRGQTLAIVLDRSADSDQANTVTLFVDGKKASEPQALPEGMAGKALFPTLTYRNMTLQANLGPKPKVALPFLCRTVADAAADDAEVVAAPSGKCEALFPVGLPGCGFFDWVDQFLKTNPGYTELSDRKMFEWAAKSGLWKPRAQGGNASNDKPDIKFGIPMLDDFSMRRLLCSLAPTVKRNYIVPELVGNLVAADRKQAVSSFPAADFKRTSCVVMGEPGQEYLAQVHEIMLEEKKSRVERQRAWQKRKQAKDETAKKAKEAKEDKEEKEAKDAEANDGEQGDEKMAEEPKDGEGKDEEASAEGEKEAKEEDEKAKEEEAKEEDEDKPVELTEEEKQTKHRPTQHPDVQERVLSKSYANFTLPAKEDGFDAITFAWQGQDACAKLLKDWVYERKMTQRVEDLQPGDWFKGEWAKWQKAVQGWKKLQNEFKDPERKERLAKKRAEAKKAEEGGDEKKEGEETAEEKAEDKAEEKAEDP